MRMTALKATVVAASVLAGTAATCATAATAQAAPAPKDSYSCLSPISAAAPAKGAPLIGDGAVRLSASNLKGWKLAKASVPSTKNGLAAVKELPKNWSAIIEAGNTNFKHPIANGEVAAKTLLACAAASQTYSNTSPSVKDIRINKWNVDGKSATRLDANIFVGKRKDIGADWVTVIVIDTNPQSYVFAAAPIKDKGDRAVIEKALTNLKVR